MGSALPSVIVGTYWTLVYARTRVHGYTQKKLIFIRESFLLTFSALEGPPGSGAARLWNDGRTRYCCRHTSFAYAFGRCNAKDDRESASAASERASERRRHPHLYPLLANAWAAATHAPCTRLSSRPKAEGPELVAAPGRVPIYGLDNILIGMELMSQGLLLLLGPRHPPRYRLVVKARALTCLFDEAAR